MPPATAHNGPRDPRDPRDPRRGPRDPPRGPRGPRGPRDPRDPLGLAADAPLLRDYLAALDRRAAGEHAFFTPGHKGSTALTGAVVAGDVGVYGGLDTIKTAHARVAEAERRAAALFGADVCRFSVGGSTHCNQALTLALGRPGDQIVVSRTLHRSVLLGLVLAGLEPVWVAPEVDGATGLAAGYAPERVAETLAAHPGAAAVFLSDPSYVGTHSDVGALVEVAHRAGVPLVVDAAWAAHFGFHPALPDHALALGADAMVTSLHKTLPAYNQAAILLVRTERIPSSRLQPAFEATHTTSPSGAITASIDAARALLEHHGERLLGRMLEAVAAARRRLAAIDGLRVLDGPGVDPAKLTVALAGTGAHGVRVESDLLAAGVPVEMADRDTIVGVVTVADDDASIERFTRSLAASIERHRGEPRTLAPTATWIVEPNLAVPPRTAFFGRSEPVAVADAVGRVSAELIAPYPPGVPVLAPGERITERTLRALLDARADGVRIAYARSRELETIDVLTDAALD